jgi:hypothetical protein
MMRIELDRLCIQAFSLFPASQPGEKNTEADHLSASFLSIK